MEDIEQAVWAAGYVSARGSLMIHQNYARLVIKCTGDDKDALLKVARAMKLRSNVTSSRINGKPGHRLTASGKPLHEGMRVLWPWLTRSRQEEYLRLRRRLTLPQ